MFSHLLVGDSKYVSGPQLSHLEQLCVIFTFIYFMKMSLRMLKQSKDIGKLCGNLSDKLCLIMHVLNVNMNAHGIVYLLGNSALQENFNVIFCYY
jgi:hypothetical protein